MMSQYDDVDTADDDNHDNADNDEKVGYSQHNPCRAQHNLRLCQPRWTLACTHHQDGGDGDDDQRDNDQDGGDGVDGVDVDDLAWSSTSCFSC